MHKILTSKSKELKQLCRKYQVERLYVFGSVTGNTFDSRSSDIDFLVSFQSGLSPQQMGANMLAMIDELEAIFFQESGPLARASFCQPLFCKSCTR